MASFTFLDVQASITGPGGTFSLGSGAGVAEEGITVEMANDKDILTIGADGTPMHGLSADRSGKVTVRLLKTSPANAQLQAMYDLQSVSSSVWGQNVITVSEIASGDMTSCRSVAFARKPVLTYAKNPGINEWQFNAGTIDTVLGTY